MAYPYEPAPDDGDGWSLNLPVAIGVVFVFLVIVVAWVIVSGNGDDGDDLAIISTTVPTESTVGSGPPVTPAAPPTTSPPLMPATVPPTATPATAVPGTAAPGTAAPGTAAPVPPTPTAAPASTTTAPAGGPATVPGDLGIDDHPMAEPVCEGEYITILASAIGDDATAAGIQQVLDEFPQSSYLRTDQACTSLAQSHEGQPIYVVFFGPFPVPEDACAARAKGTPDAYAKQLTNSGGATGAVRCDSSG